MNMRIKTSGKRVMAYYERESKIGGITLGVYGDDMFVEDVATLGYDKKEKKMVLQLHDLDVAGVEIRFGNTRKFLALALAECVQREKGWAE